MTRPAGWPAVKAGCGEAFPAPGILLSVFWFSKDALICGDGTSRRDASGGSDGQGVATIQMLFV